MAAELMFRNELRRRNDWNHGIAMMIDAA